MTNERTSPYWRPSWDQDPVTETEWICMTAYIYQTHKRTLDELQIETLDQLVRDEGRTGVGLRNPETKRQLVRWLTLEPIPDNRTETRPLQISVLARYL